MLGVTLFGIFLTPVFYYVIQWVSDVRRKENREAHPSTTEPAIRFHVAEGEH